MNKRTVLSNAVFFALASAYGASTYAQSGAELVLEEVIVSAQKRDESLQEVPISISVTTNEDLQIRGITNLDELASQVPGFNVGSSGAVTNVAIRGFAGTGSDIIESPVVTLIDGAFISNNRLITSGFYDLNRIEVLKGPQGTLFGKNALGGVLQIVTAEPTEEFSGYANLELGNYDLRRVDAAVSGKLADGLYGRLSGIFAESDGWMDNARGVDGGGIKDQNIRLRLRWDVSDKFSIDAKYEHLDHENKGTTLQIVDVLDESILSTRRFQVLTPRDLETNADDKQAVGPGDFVAGTILDRQTTGQDQNGDLALLKFTYAFDSGYDLASITNWVDYTNERRLDADSLPFGSLPVYNDQDYTTLSQEFQIRSPSDRDFSFITGIYIEKNEIWRAGPVAFDFDASGGISDNLVVPTLFAPYQVLAPGDLATAQPGIQEIQDALIRGAHLTVDLGPGEQELERDIWSVYFEGKYQFNDKWALTAGVRYSEDEFDAEKESINLNSSGDPLSSRAWMGDFMSALRSDPRVLAAEAVYPGGLQSGFFQPGFPVIDIDDDFFTAVEETVGLAYSFVQLPDGHFDDSRKESSTTPSVKLQYFANDDAMFYGSVSTGFKGGGFNLDAVTTFEVTEFESENAISFELGGKLTLLDGAAQVNFAIFRTEFEDLQLAAVNELGTFSFQNASDATSQGLEFDAIWKMSEAFTASLAYTYLDAKYDDFKTAPCSIFDPNDSSTCVQDLSGESLQRAPDHQASVTLEYFHSFNSAWQFEAVLGGSYTDEFSVTAANDFYAEDTFSVFSRIAFVNSDSKLSIAARVDNLTDEDDIIFQFPTPLVPQIVVGSIRKPTTYSVQIRKDF